MLRDGYHISFSSVPLLSQQLTHLPSYFPNSIGGSTLSQEIASLLFKEAIELADCSPVYHSRVFLSMKVSGQWKPIIGLSKLNQSVGEFQVVSSKVV